MCIAGGECDRTRLDCPEENEVSSQVVACSRYQEILNY